MSGCNSDDSGNTRNPFAKFDRKAKTFLKDSSISEDECKELQSIISNSEELKSELNSAQAFERHIKGLANKLADRKRNPISLPIEINIPDNDFFAIKKKSGDNNAGDQSSGISGPDKIAYNFFIENSGSVFGYLNDNTAFKDVVLGLMTKINRYDEGLNLKFVNDLIYDYKIDSTEVLSDAFNDFMKYLNPRSLRKIGNIKSSNLTDILQKVIEKQMGKGLPSVLFSDFIFSISKTNNVRRELSSQKHGITNVIHGNELKEKDIGFLILFFNSKFTGRYYKYTNESVWLKDADRPYYVWVIGKMDVLKEFIEKYEIKEFKGYENHLIIGSSQNQNKPFSTILKKTGVEGKFNLTDRGADEIHAIKDIRYSKRKKIFRFSIAIDAADINAGERYVSNSDSWAVESSSGDEFYVVGVEKYNIRNISPLDKKHVEDRKVSHVITLEADKISSGEQKLTLTLKKELPTWVNDYSTDDDLDMSIKSRNLKRTFGLKDLIQGVWEEYTDLGAKEDYYFKLSYSLER